MIIIGITGSLATGKSYLATILGLHKIRVFDADKCALRVAFENEETKAKIGKVFFEGNSNFTKELLSKLVLSGHDKMDALERILHPQVEREMVRFLQRSMRQKQKMVALEVPLLYEASFNVYCDYIIVMSAPEYLIKTRAMKRKGMTEDKFRFLLSRQLPTKIKAHYADFVIDSSLGKSHTIKQLKEVLQCIEK